MLSFSKLTLASAAIALFTGCQTTPKSVTGPDGTPHLLVSCSDIEGCYASAREACSSNYKIVNTTADTSGFGDKHSSSVSTTQNMLVKCVGPRTGPKIPADELN